MSENWHQVQLMTQADWRNASATRRRQTATGNDTEVAGSFRSLDTTTICYAAWLSALIYWQSLNFWSNLLWRAGQPPGSGTTPD